MFQFDASDCLRDLKTIERRVLDVARVGLGTVVKVAYRSILESTLFKDRTGELRGTTDIVDTGAFKKRLIMRAPHALFINEGTKPHVILPKNVPFLRFVVGGRVVFAKKVNHPGTAKRPVLENAAAVGGQAMKVIFEEGTAKAVDYRS